MPDKCRSVSPDCECLFLILFLHDRRMGEREGEEMFLGPDDDAHWFERFHGGKKFGQGFEKRRSGDFLHLLSGF